MERNLGRVEASYGSRCPLLRYHPAGRDLGTHHRIVGLRDASGAWLALGGVWTALLCRGPVFRDGSRVYDAGTPFMDLPFLQESDHSGALRYARPRLAGVGSGLGVPLLHPVDMSSICMTHVLVYLLEHPVYIESIIFFVLIYVFGLVIMVAEMRLDILQVKVEVVLALRRF